MKKTKKPTKAERRLVKAVNAAAGYLNDLSGGRVIEDDPVGHEIFSELGTALLDIQERRMLADLNRQVKAQKAVRHG